MGKKKNKGTTWADVSKGSVVNLAGKPWLVTKYKLKGSTVKVTVEGASQVYVRELPASAAVELWTASTVSPAYNKTGAAQEKVPTKGPLHETNDDGGNAQRRWAKDSEGYDAPEKLRDGKGWAKPQGKVEKTLAEFGAVLLGATENEPAGWYVPPVDPSTIASHLFLFHNVDAGNRSYAELVEAHSLAHTVEPCFVNHTHSKVRP